MSEKGKGKAVVEVVLEKKKKNGDPYWGIIIDGKEYYDSKGNFKDKKGLEIEFEYSTSDDGNITFINPVGGGFKGGSGGSRAKSPEEIALQKKSFAYSYAKDLTCAIITAHAPLIKELPKDIKHLDFLSFMADTSLVMTEKIGAGILKKLSE
jgi:hypothetical protein